MSLPSRNFCGTRRLVDICSGGQFQWRCDDVFFDGRRLSYLARSSYLHGAYGGDVVGNCLFLHGNSYLLDAALLAFF